IYFLMGQFTGKVAQSDISNSLKMGFDLLEMKWPDFIETALDLDTRKLPSVYKTGEVVGMVLPSIASEFGFFPSLPIVAGATDGTAAFFASGARIPGDVSCTLGTTPVVRSLSEKLVKDPQGRIYCHRHPEGYWLPGGASNTGGECLKKFFPDGHYEIWDQEVMKINLPTSLLVYPLTRTGERLPFASSMAEFFQIGKERNRTELYAACLEGVGYIERYSYSLLEKLGSTPIRRVFSSGSGARSGIWRQIRSNILGKPVHLPATTESAMGACIIAATPLLGSLSRAGAEMVTISDVIEPENKLIALYDEKYHLFVEECQKRGLIPRSEHEI
ncbi:MAG: FGGY-family carbohydrate kinase, partial [Atribacterota bacterium]